MRIIERTAENIKAARIEKQLTQVEAAKLCGVGLATFKSWESGNHIPNDLNWSRVKRRLIEEVK